MFSEAGEICLLYLLLLIFNLQISPKQMSPKTVAPPPPPPPPPMDHSPMKDYKSMGNGDVSNGMAGNKLITPQKISQKKKILPAIDDTRNDLLKAIRDGKQYAVYLICSNKCDPFSQLPNHFILHCFRYHITKSREKWAERKGTFNGIPWCCIDISQTRCNRIIWIRRFRQWWR